MELAVEKEALPVDLVALAALEEARVALKTEL